MLQSSDGGYAVLLLLCAILSYGTKSPNTHTAGAQETTNNGHSLSGAWQRSAFRSRTGSRLEV